MTKTDDVGTSVSIPPAPEDRLLHNLQASALIGSLTGGLGHDIRNLVMPALLRLDVIELHPGLSDGTKRDLSNIRRSIAQLQQLADALRQFEANPFEQNGKGSTSLAEWWRGMHMVVGSIMPSHTVVRAEIAADLPHPAVPAVALAHVTLSLLLNARRALVGVARPVIDLCAVRDESGLIVRVTDNGSGMTPEVAAHCFDPFFTTHADEGASGLGLFTSRALMRRYHGDLELEASRSPQGATLVLRMPLDTATSSPASTPITRLARLQVQDARHDAVLRLILSQHDVRVLPPDDSVTAVDVLIGDPPSMAALLESAARVAHSAASAAAPHHAPQLIVLSSRPPDTIDVPQVHWLDPKDIPLVGDLLR